MENILDKWWFQTGFTDSSVSILIIIEKSFNEFKSLHQD